MVEVVSRAGSSWGERVERTGASVNHRRPDGRAPAPARTGGGGRAAQRTTAGDHAPLMNTFGVADGVPTSRDHTSVVPGSSVRASP